MEFSADNSLTKKLVLAAGMPFIILFVLYFGNIYIVFKSPLALFIIASVELVASLVGFLLFYRTAEFFEESGDFQVLFFGGGFLFASIMDIFHVLAYEGMPHVFFEPSHNLAIQLWAAGNFICAIIILIGHALVPELEIAERKSLLKKVTTFIILLSILTAAFMAKFSGALPAMFIEGAGTTEFDKQVEFATIAFFSLFAVFFLRKYMEAGSQISLLFSTGFVLLAFGDLFYAIHRVDGDIFMMFAHFFKLSAFSYIALDMIKVSKLDWKQIEREIEFKKIEEAEICLPAFKAILDSSADSSIVVVEIEDASVLSFSKSLFTRGCPPEYYMVPMLSVTSPRDIKPVLERMGSKTGLWVTESDTKDELINEKFVLIRPEASDIYLMTNFMRMLCDKAKSEGKQLIFVGDFLDDLYGLIDKPQLHQLISGIRSLLQEYDYLLFVIVQKNIYAKDDIALIERYADAKVSVIGETAAKVIFHDFRKGTVTNPGKISFSE